MRFIKDNGARIPRNTTKDLRIGDMLSTHQEHHRGFILYYSRRDNTPYDPIICHGTVGTEAPVIYCFDRRAATSNVTALVYMGACKCMTCSAPSVHSKYYSFLYTYKDSVELVWMSARHLEMAIPEAVINPL
jgi:hypothetical protein